MSDWTMEMIKKGCGLPPLPSKTENKENNIIDAVNAKRLTFESKKNINEQEFESIMNKIKSEAKQGNTQCLLGSISRSNQEKLTDLGYKVESYVSYFAGWMYTISW